MYFSVYWCTLVYSSVNGCTAMYMGVKQCTLVYSSVHGCTVVYMGVPMYTAVHSCTLLYTHVHRCTPMYTAVHPCTLYALKLPCCSLYVYTSTLHQHHKVLAHMHKCVLVLMISVRCATNCNPCTPCTLVYCKGYKELWSYNKPHMERERDDGGN